MFASIPVSIILKDQIKTFMMAGIVSGTISDFGTIVIRNLVARVGPDPINEFHVSTKRESLCENAPPSPCIPIGMVRWSSSSFRPGCDLKNSVCRMLFQYLCVAPTGPRTAVSHHDRIIPKRAANHMCGSKKGCEVLPGFRGIMDQKNSGAPAGCPNADTRER